MAKNKEKIVYNTEIVEETEMFDLYKEWEDLRRNKIFQLGVTVIGTVFNLGGKKNDRNCKKVTK